MRKESSRRSKKKTTRSSGRRGNSAARGARSAGSSSGKKTRDATPQQRQYVAGRLAGKSKRKAAIDAGYAPSTASNAKQKIDERKSVQALFKEILDRAGATDELLARRVYQGLHAMETKFFQKDGAVVTRRNVVNFAERRQMTELALRTKGILVDKYQVEAGPTLLELLEESFAARG